MRGGRDCQKTVRELVSLGLGNAGESLVVARFGGSCSRDGQGKIE